MVAGVLFSALSGYYWGLRSISSIIRALLVGKTRCFVFRRFSKNAGESNRSIILPTIGAFAYPVCYDDITMMGVEPTRSWVTGDLFANYFALMPEGEKNWKIHVKSEMTLMDFAVFDWTQAPTATMKEELGWALELIPTERIAIIFSKSTSGTVDAILEHYQFNPKYKFMLNENRIQFSKSLAHFFGQVNIP